MKFDEIVEMIEGIKDPCKKRDILVKATLIVKKQLGVLNKMWDHLNIGEEDENDN